MPALEVARTRERRDVFAERRVAHFGRRWQHGPGDRLPRGRGGHKRLLQRARRGPHGGDGTRGELRERRARGLVRERLARCVLAALRQPVEHRALRLGRRGCEEVQSARDVCFITARGDGLRERLHERRGCTRLAQQLREHLAAATVER